MRLTFGPSVLPEKEFDDRQKTKQKPSAFYKKPLNLALILLILMGIGQVVTVKILTSKLCDLNLTIDNSSRGAFNTEFYPTYDYMPIWKEKMSKKKPLLF